MKLKLAFTTVLLLISFLIFAETQKKDPIFEYLSGTKDNAEIKFSLGDYSRMVVNTSNGDAVIINTIEGSKFQIKNAPDLPKISKSIIIPDYALMEIKIKEKKYIEIENILIAPSKGVITRDKNPDDIPFVFGKTYQKNEFFPGEIAELGEPYILRDFRGQVINIMPFQYNPVSKVLRIYTEITFEIVENTNMKSGINVFNRTKSSNKINGEFNEIYKNHFLNYSGDSKYNSLEEEGNMLIICHTDYFSALDTFVNWKNQRGLKTELVEYSSIGSSANDIKSYVENYYNTNDLVYLLLVGDAEQIPSLEKSGDSDAAYGHITGDDSYAEVFVGRFSSETIADIETQVSRTIYYERDMNTDANWLSKGIGIASDEGTSGDGDDGESDVQHMDNIRTDLLNYGYDLVDQIYDPGALASTVAESVNNGRSVINYVGHGSNYSWGTTGFSTTNVNALTNENMLPYIFDVACVNGNFHGQTCFAESWLRATNNNNPTGAIAIIASTINQSWASPMDAQDEMVDILTESYENNIKRTFGGITINGCMHMIDEYGTDGANMTNTWTIFGDPSLLIRTKAPKVMSITHNPIIYVGATEFEVSGDEDCFVSLIFNNELISTGVINGGSANLEFNALPSDGILTVTVTGYNKVTYIAKVNIEAPSAPCVIHKSNSINDIAGNNNQQADYGESLKWNVELKNISDAYDAFLVNATITTLDTNVIITDSIETYGTILKSDSLLIESAFGVDIKSKIENQHTVLFNLKVVGEDSEGVELEWNSNFTLVLNAPQIEIGNLFIDDASGDNDNILDPGETADICLIVSNTGDAAISNLSGIATLLGNSSLYLTLNNSEITNISLDAQQTDTLRFNTTVDSDTPVGTSVYLNFNIDDFNNNFYSKTQNKKINIGEIPEVLISEGDTVTTNNSYFYDSGGKADNYSSSENYIITFTPENDNTYLMVNFLSFDVEADGGGCYDYLKIYDGESTSATLIGTYCNSNNPTTIIATNASGSLTFKFYSDSYVTKRGWEAEIKSYIGYDYQVIVSGYEGLIEGATVEFNGITKTTGIDGIAEFNNVPEGINYLLTISAPYHEDFEASINLLEDKSEEFDLDVSKYDVMFNLFDEDGLIDGDITFDGRTLTTINGIITFTNVEYSLNEVYIIHAYGHIDSTASLVVNANLSEDFVLKIIKHDIEFVISNSTDPLRDAIVEFDNKEILTTIDGIALFNQVKMDTMLTYIIRKTGYDNIEGILDVEKDSTVNFVMSPGEATFKVSFLVTGETNPIYNARVILNEDTLYTNNKGVAVFENVSEAGDIPYKITKVHFNDIVGLINVAGNNIDVDTMLTYESYEIIFSINDGVNPIEGANISFDGKSGTSDSNGECVFDVIYSLNKTYTVSKDRYHDASGMINVDEDKTIEQSMALITYNVTFVVVDASSHVAENVLVEFNSENKYTNSSGEALFTEIAIGENLNFLLKKENYWDYDSTLNVEDADVVFNAVLSSTTSIISVDKENIKIYPNPSNGIFNLEINNAETIQYSIKVFDVLGSVIYQNQINGSHNINQQIDLSTYAKGIYFLSVESEYNVVTGKRIIIK